MTRLERIEQRRALEQLHHKLERQNPLERALELNQIVRATRYTTPAEKKAAIQRISKGMSPEEKKVFFFGISTP